MRKIPRLGLLMGLLMVGVLLVAAIPADVEAQAPRMTAYGVAYLDGGAADEGTEVKIYIGSDTTATATTTVDTFGGTWPDGTYGGVTVLSTEGRIGDSLRYTVGGYEVVTMDKDPLTGDPNPTTPIFCLTNQDVDLWALREEAPEVTTVAASSKTDVSATLNGYLDDLGDFSSVDVYFEYGLDTGYGIPTSLVTQNAIGSFSAPISGLDPLTEYHYRACCDYDTTPVCGADESFTTDAEPVWPHVESLGSGLNIISTPVWLASASDTVDQIIPPADYNGGYRWTGTSFASLSTSYVWKPLEAFYVDVAASTTATFVPTTDMKAPNTRVLQSNKWYLIGSSPFGGSGCQTMDDVLVNLADNWSVVVKPTAANQAGASCTVNNPTALTLCAYEGAFVYVGARTTRTIVGFCTTPVE